MNAQTFNALINQQVPRLTLRQREQLKKRLNEFEEQQKGWLSLNRPARLSHAAVRTARAVSFTGMARSAGCSATAAGRVAARSTP
jgi:hypothetical protein